MTTEDRNSEPAANPEPAAFASFGADGEAFASNRRDPGPNGWSLGGPLLFAAVVIVLTVLRGVGVLPS